ncbi:MAG: T9SS type A sorting domain-containing protein [Bacteroidota bacterium]
MKKANFTTTPFGLLSKAVLALLMVCSVFALQAQSSLSATCGGGPYFDTGGSTKPYDDDVIQTYTVCPDNPMTEYVRIVFNQYDVADGDVLDVYDGDDDSGPLIASTGEGSSVADSPGGGWIDASACGVDTDNDGDLDSDDDLSGCLTLVFTPNGDQTKGAGYAFHVECRSKGFNFPSEGGEEVVTAIASIGEFCELDGITFNYTPPVYSDCAGGGLIATSDCPDVIITPSQISVPIGTTIVTFNSSLYPEKKVTWKVTALPPSLACNDAVNVSLLNDCVIAVTPDLILEDPCEFADGLSGTSAYDVDYTVEFTDPNVLIVGTTLGGFPVADFSGVPCGTRLDVKVTRNITSECSEDYIDLCWGFVVIEDKIDPILEQEIETYTVDCYDVPDNFLDILNGRARGTNGIFVGDVATLLFNGTPTGSIAGIGDANFPGFDNCKFEYNVGAWQEVSFDCTTDAIDSHSQDFFDDPLWEIMMVEFGPEARFRLFFRTVQIADKCGNDSNFGIQRIFVVQPDIVHPKLEISLDCKEDPDPVAIYNKYLSDPNKFQEFACFIPNYDRTPANLNGDFNGFAGLDDTYLTDCSGDEVPADPTSHDECGYAIDWDDSDRIDVCAETYKIFREWTVYNWCDGHLEIIDVIPQVVKVGDTDAPELDVLGLSVVGGAYYNCAADVELSVDFIDDCSGNVQAFYQIFDFSSNEPLLPGFNNAEFDATAGTIRIPEFPIAQDVFVRLRFIDECGNSSEFSTFRISIDDEVPPVAICESFRAISMGIGCEVVVPAEVFDDGSYDNCGTVSFSVARMDDVGDFLVDNDGDGLIDELDGDDDVFEPTITFTQDDLDDCTGNVMVVFRVQDNTGIDLNGDHDFNDPGERFPNSNFCMVEVELQDKLPPALASGKLTYDCDEPFADLILNTAAADNAEEAFAQLVSDALADQLTDLFGNDNCGIASFEVSSLRNQLNVACREGSIFISYQATDNCGNVSNVATVEFCLVQRSDWKMNFPMDAEVFCEDDGGLPAAASVEDIVDNDGCDFWALEDVVDQRFTASDGACFKVIREYHLINWCTWNPNNTEVAVVERPQELILDPFYTVALRYADLCVNGTDCQGGNAQPDGLNDFDDGNEDGDDRFLYRSTSDIYGTFAPISIPFSSSQQRRINDRDEAEVCDPYDVTDATIDADWVIIDFNDFPAAVNGDIVTAVARSQFSNVEESYVSAQEYGNIVYRQIIKVNDITNPVIDVTQSGPFCGGYDDPGEDGICSGEVNVKFTASDLCSDDIDVTYTLVAFKGISHQEVTLSQSQDGFGDLNADGGDFSITGNYPIGTHEFIVTVSDNCGNTEEEVIEFTVNDCKAPTAKCIFGLAVDLMGPNSNGSAGMVTIPAEWFDKDSYDFCSDVTLTFADPNIFPDSTERTFRCADGEIGVVAVELWVQDAAGNTAFCETFVNVQANPQNDGEEDICPTAPGAAAIAGGIETESSETVENVEVTLSGSADGTYMTGEDGAYQFNNLEEGYDYSVTPQLDLEPLNGVSTFDLVLISKHILGVEVLDSPYKIIAADVNNSKSVTTFDIVQLRKVLLGHDDSFPGNTSWRFVASDYEFVDAANPLDEDFDELMNLNDLEGSYLTANFVAVKVGDVNDSATPSANSIEERNVSGTFALNAADVQLTAGQEYAVEFTADLTSVLGYQFTMNLNGLEAVRVTEGEATEANFGLFGNVVTASWNNEATSDLAFTLVVRATEDVTLSEAMNITSDVTTAEAYNATGETQAVALNFGKAGYALGQNNPNPFKGETLIQVTMPDAQRASLRVHDVTGKVLKEIVQDFDQGTTTIKLNSKDLQAGVLYYTLQAEDFTVTKKMIVLD